VILIGQPELQLLLKRQELRQLAQRITARYHLLPLNEDEIALYVLHRLQVAGRFEPLFTRKAVNVLQKYSGGIPRLINLLCERSLMAGYAQSRVPIDHHMVRQAAAEVLGEEEPTQNRYLWPTATAAALCVAFGVSYWLFTDKSANTVPASNLVTESVPTNVASLNAQTLGGEDVADKSVKPTNQPSGQTSIPDPNQRLLNEAINQSRNIDTAFAGLFSVWGKVPYKGLTACQSAVEQGLACYQQQGNWMSLTRLNYPAVVYLVDDKQQDFYGAVLAVEGEQLLMQLGEQQLWVDRAWFNQHFSGTFEILWQAPNLPMMDISQKSSPGQLQWLENALAHVNGRSPRRVNQFDVQLENDLKTFQSQHGLKADGIAGNQTLVRLNLYLSQQGPRLTDDGARS
jgi:general secretion pathway protein A